MNSWRLLGWLTSSISRVEVFKEIGAYEQETRYWVGIIAASAKRARPNVPILYARAESESFDRKALPERLIVQKQLSSLFRADFVNLVFHVLKEVTLPGSRVKMARC